LKAVNMPTWNQIQSQLRNPNNPVVFFDISVRTTVTNLYKLGLHVIDVIEMTYNTYYACYNAGLYVVATACDMVRTMSRPSNCCVLPEGSHSSSSRIKILWQCMILHTWSAPETCSWDTMCSFSLSLFATIYLQLLSGNIF